MTHAELFLTFLLAALGDGGLCFLIGHATQVGDCRVQLNKVVVRLALHLITVDVALHKTDVGLDVPEISGQHSVDEEWQEVVGTNNKPVVLQNNYVNKISE